MELVVVMPESGDGKKNTRLSQTVSGEIRELSSPGGFPEISIRWIRSSEEFIWEFTGGNLKNIRILFLCDIGNTGINLALYSMMQAIRQEREGFAGSIGGIVVDGKSQFYTKAFAREFVLSANGSGCLFVGRSLVEATGDLENFSTAARVKGISPEKAYQEAVRELVMRILKFHPKIEGVPKILCLHSCNVRTSNTYMLWKMVKKYLENGCAIHEISFKNGEIKDCLGCSYDTCLKYGKNTKCYYGGVIVDDVYPAVEECDMLMLLCPNYNDALGANLTAFINRLTALYRKRQFYEKYLFSIVVSGYSGGDLVAEQVIDAVSMNKTFILPPYFALMKMANEPGSIRETKGIEQQAKEYAEGMIHTAKGS